MTSFRPPNVVDTVYVYDAMLSIVRGTPYLTQTLKRQLPQVYGSSRRGLTVRCPRATQQDNAIDCGVFAVAYAVDLCMGKDPAQRQYDIDSMRRHLIACFRSGKLSRFPSTGPRASATYSVVL